MKTFRLGCSGWSYKHWVGVFYPEHTPAGRMLNEYQRFFDTVELNMSFYRFPSEAAISKWKEETREDFLFAAKMNRTITHLKRLKGASALASDFIERMSRLEDKLGPILMQLPPSLGPDHALLDEFLSDLPPGHKYSVEFRNKGWLVQKTLDVLSRHDVALCLIDSPGFKITEGVTAPFVYVRWHGTQPRYRGDYSEDEVRVWAERLIDMDVDEIYGYWNNDIGGHAPKDCLTMKSILEEERRTVLA